MINGTGSHESNHQSYQKGCSQAKQGVHVGVSIDKEDGSNQTIIIPKDFCKSGQNLNKLSQAKMAGKTRSVIANTNKSLINSFASEILSPLTLNNKDHVARHASGKDAKMSNVAASFIGTSVPIANSFPFQNLGSINATSKQTIIRNQMTNLPLRDPDYSQSIKRSRIHQNKINPTYPGKSLVDDRNQILQTSNFSLNTQKGEPTLPGPLGWPKLTNSPNSQLVQKELIQSQPMISKDTNLSSPVFQNITKFGKKKQVNLTTPDKSTNIGPEYQDFDLKNKDQQNNKKWQNLNHLSPVGAYSSTAPQITENFANSEESSPVVQSVRPESILSRNLYKNYNNTQIPSSLNPSVKISLKQIIPKNSTSKTSEQLSNNSGSYKQKDGIINGQTKNSFIKNKNDNSHIQQKSGLEIQQFKNQNQNIQNSFELISRQEKTNDNIIKFSGNRFESKSPSRTGQIQTNSIDKSRHSQKDAEQIKQNQTELKEFPLSTKNKSMPPFSLSNTTSISKIDFLNRNQQNIVLNPIHQTKKQYYHQMIPEDLGDKFLNVKQPIRGINNFQKIEGKDTYRSMKQPVEHSHPDQQLKDMQHQTNKSYKQTQLKTIDIEPNKQQSLFRTQWNAQHSWEQKLVDISNDSININKNKQTIYQGLPVGTTQTITKKQGLQVFSPQIKKHSMIGTSYRSPIQTNMAVQLQEAYQSPVISNNLNTKNPNRKNSKIQQISKDPESDLSQLDRFDKVIQNKLSRNPYDSSQKEKYYRYRVDDTQHGDNLSQIHTGTNDKELNVIKYSCRSDYQNKKQRQVYQPAAVGANTATGIDKKVQNADIGLETQSKKKKNLLNIEPLHQCLIYLKPSKSFEHRNQSDSHEFHEEPFNLFQLKFLHFSEQFFFATKSTQTELNLQNLQRAALLVLVVAKAMKAVQLVKLSNTKFIQIAQDSFGDISNQNSKGTQNQFIQEVNRSQQQINQFEHELYLNVKEIVGGICNWVLKRIIKPKQLNNQGFFENASIQDNQWVKKIHQIIKSQYQDKFLEVQAVDYAQITSCCTKIQEKLASIRAQIYELCKDIKLETPSKIANQPNMITQGKQVVKINFEKLQYHLQLMSQIIQQTIVQQESQKIISIEKFLLIMNKLDQFDQQIALHLSNNIATSNLPRSIIESAMTTFGIQHHQIHHSKVDRKKNSTPDSFISQIHLNKLDQANPDYLKDRNDILNDNDRSIQNQVLKQKKQSHNQNGVGQFINHFKLNSTQVNEQTRNKSNIGMESDQTSNNLFNNLLQNDTNQSFVLSNKRETSSGLTLSQENILVDLTSHQQQLRDRIKEIDRSNQYINKSEPVDQGALESQTNKLTSLSSGDNNRNSIFKNELATADAQLCTSDNTQLLNNCNLNQYALVLDLDETLVHFKDQKFLTDDQKLKIRPGVSQFLEALDPYYTFVVFTAAQKMYADFVIKKIDPHGKYIKERFYRNQCKQIGRHQAKDLNLVLNCLNRRIHQHSLRQSNSNFQQGGNQNLLKEDEPNKTLSLFDLNKVIIIDNLSESFQLQPLNGIKIKDWFGNDLADRHLIDLIPPLKNIAENQVHDVRLELSKIRKNYLHSTIGNGPLVGAIYANGSSFGVGVGSQYSAFGNQRFSHNQLPSTNSKKFSIGYKN